MKHMKTTWWLNVRPQQAFPSTSPKQAHYQRNTYPFSNKNYRIIPKLVAKGGHCTFAHLKRDSQKQPEFYLLS